MMSCDVCPFEGGYQYTPTEGTRDFCNVYTVGADSWTPCAQPYPISNRNMGFYNLGGSSVRFMGGSENVESRVFQLRLDWTWEELDPLPGHFTGQAIVPFRM